jgi:hypothetical protein
MHIVKLLLALSLLAENLIQQQSGQFSQLSFSLQVTNQREWLYQLLFTVIKRSVCINQN